MVLFVVRFAIQNHNFKWGLKRGVQEKKCFAKEAKLKTIFNFYKRDVRYKRVPEIGLRQTKSSCGTGLQTRT